MQQLCQIGRAFGLKTSEFLTLEIPMEQHALVPEKDDLARFQFKQPVHESAEWVRFARSRALILDGGDHDGREYFVRQLFARFNWPIYIPDRNEDLIDALRYAYEESIAFFYPSNLIYEHPGNHVLDMLDCMHELLSTLKKHRDWVDKSSFGVVLGGNPTYISRHDLAVRARRIDLRYSRALVAIAA